MMLIYAAGIGIGYGLTFFAATILLLDYFGRGPYLELFSTVNLISTVGAVAPTLAGLTRDHTGGFAPFFMALSVLVALVLLAVVMMRAPHKSAGMKEFGVFLPVANGGWIVSRTTPVLDGGWAQNRDAALLAEEEGFDFVMAMGKWRGFGGDTGHWGHQPGSGHHDGGHRRRHQPDQDLGDPARHPAQSGGGGEDDRHPGSYLRRPRRTEYRGGRLSRRVRADGRLGRGTRP